MYSLQFGLALAAVTAVSGYPLTLGDSGFPLSHMVTVGDSAIPRIPAAWLQGDPADSLYRAARERRSTGGSIGLRPTSFAQIPVSFCPLRLCWGRALLAGLRALSAGGRPGPQDGSGGAAAAEGALSPGGHPRRRRLPWRAGSWESWPAGATVTRRPRFRGPPPALRRPRLRHHLPHRRRQHHRRRLHHRRRPHRRVHHSRSSSRSSSSSRCSSDDDDMKVAALNALQQMDAARARPILRRVLAKRDTAICLHSPEGRFPGSPAE